jgi:hypothetical protein
MSDRIYYSREAEERAQRQRMVAVLVFMALGLGVGAVIAMMFTPEGQKARKKMGKAVEDGLDTGREKISDVMSELEDEYPGVLHKFEALLTGLR